MSVKDPCLKKACAIQKCLQANNYDESRCEDVIQALRKCCEDHAGEDLVCCSGFAQLQRIHREEEKSKQDKIMSPV